VKTIAIERKASLSPDTFVRDHLHGIGKPVIVTDAMERWPAVSKWSFEYLKSSYGADFGTASTGFYSEASRLTRVDAYFDYLDNPTRELPGFWIRNQDCKPMRGAPAPADTPFYLVGWYAFQKHPELYEDITPAPYFVADWLLAFNPTMREIFEYAAGREYWSLYVGPAGSLSKLHTDFWRTHAYLAQIRGRKKCLLFSPTDSPYLYNGEVDPENPDLERFALFDRATAYECVLEPGEMLFMPADWWHQVRALEKSITISHNFFNDSNVNDHLAGIMGKLPMLAERFGKDSDWRRTLAPGTS